MPTERFPERDAAVLNTAGLRVEQHPCGHPRVWVIAQGSQHSGLPAGFQDQVGVNEEEVIAVGDGQALVESLPAAPGVLIMHGRNGYCAGHFRFDRSGELFDQFANFGTGTIIDQNQLRVWLDG